MRVERWLKSREVEFVAARLQLILAGERVAASASDVWVDEEYRAPVDDLPDRTWPASAPVIVDLGGPL